jgi:hypothetical protein
MQCGASMTLPEISIRRIQVGGNSHHARNCAHASKKGPICGRILRNWVDFTVKLV